MATADIVIDAETNPAANLEARRAIRTNESANTGALVRGCST
jgi:hypothetical protein